jgi:hypothetical protein
VRAHVDDEGLFAFETRNPRWATQESNAEEWASLRSHDGDWALLETREREEEWPGYTDSSGREARRSKTQVSDHFAQILHWTTYRRWREGDQEETKVTRIALRFAFPQELAALLRYNGFTLLREYGDWNLEPLTAASRSIIVVCRKRA